MNSYFIEEETGSEKLSHALQVSQPQMGVEEELTASLEAPGHGG